MKSNNYTEEFKKYVKLKSKTMTKNDLKKLVEKKFNICMTRKGFDSYLYRHKIKCIDYNINKIREKNINRVPIGTERITIRGMVKIKIKQPDVWEWKNRYMYKKYHNCKLKSDDSILFLNQNKLDFRKENLIKISRRESAVISGKRRMTSKDPKLTKTGILVAKLMIATKEVRKLDVKRI